MATDNNDKGVKTLHYKISWFEDIIHEYGHQTADEYFVEYNGKKLVLNIDSYGKQNCFFTDAPRNVYSIGVSCRVRAEMQEIYLPEQLITDAYKLAEMEAEWKRLRVAMKIPKVPSINVEEEFTKGYELTKEGAFVLARQCYKNVLHQDPSHVASTYNMACIAGSPEEAVGWMDRLLGLRYTDVLTIVNDSDFYGHKDVLKEQIVKMYRCCIMDNFQGSYKNKIDLEKYNRVYKQKYGSAELAKLQDYGIDPSLSLEW